MHRVECDWGDVFSPEQIDEALKRNPAKLVALVHAETSTGALQPMEGIAQVVHGHGALLLLDCVTSLGGLSRSSWTSGAWISPTAAAKSAWAALLAWRR